MLDAARIGAVLLLGLLAFLFVVRPVVRRGLRPAAQGVLAAGTLPQQLPRTVDELQGELEATLETAERSNQPNKMTALTKRLTTITQKEPEHAAQLIRAWLTEEGGR